MLRRSQHCPTRRNIPPHSVFNSTQRYLQRGYFIYWFGSHRVRPVYYLVDQVKKESFSRYKTVAGSRQQPSLPKSCSNAHRVVVTQIPTRSIRCGSWLVWFTNSVEEALGLHLLWVHRSYKLLRIHLTVGSITYYNLDSKINIYQNINLTKYTDGRDGIIR